MAALLSSSDIYWTRASGPEVEAGIGPHRVGEAPGVRAVLRDDSHGHSRERCSRRTESKGEELGKRVGASECCLRSGVQERALSWRAPGLRMEIKSLRTFSCLGVALSTTLWQRRTRGCRWVWELSACGLWTTHI